MKKIYYIVSLAVLALFTSCQDFNETNFPGYKDAAVPSNVATYTYSLTANDYATIATTIKKPVNDSITLLKTQLKTASATDSVTIQANITRLGLKLTTDSTMLAATAIGANKLFINQQQFSVCVPIILNAKYLYADAKSSAMVSFNLSYDTTKIAIANKYTLSAQDYLDMGVTVVPGDLSASKDPNFYIPILLKKIYPYALTGDLKLVHYKYYASSVISSLATVFLFDGTNWVNYNASAKTSVKFSFKNKTWVFINSEILIEKFAKDFGTFTPVIVKGTYTWTHGTYNGGCFVANAYKQGEVEIWMVSPLIDLKDRVNPTFSFDHSINYYASGMVMSDLLGAYISTNYTTDPTTATWKKLDIIYPTSTAPTWSPFVNSGKVSISDYNNQKVTIAFKYVSTGTAMAWEVSNVNVLDE